MYIINCINFCQFFDLMRTESRARSSNSVIIVLQNLLKATLRAKYGYIRACTPAKIEFFQQIQELIKYENRF